MMKTCPRLTKEIPKGHVMLLYFVRTEYDSRDCAGSTGWLIRSAKGCIKAARDLDTHGSRDLHDNKGHGYVVPGHGVTVLWPSGHSRNIREED